MSYVPNDVFKFRISLKDDSIDRTVFTKPFPQFNDKTDEVVLNKYFTKERIEGLKDEFIRKIRESDNPFNIVCVDIDGDYNVTQEELFDLNNYDSNSR